MIGLLQKKSLKFFHPVLKRLAKYYLSKPRNYRYEDINITVFPGVFHPGLFFSTKVFIEFLKGIDLKGKHVLELGAGSGLISIFCAKQGAHVTSSDINEMALEKLRENARQNQVSLEIVVSDLFDELDPNNFEQILINPPYYPKQPANMEENAWFCGEDFEYFKKLFNQIENLDRSGPVIWMILSEDCDLERITTMAASKGIQFKEAYMKVVSAEKNYIYELERSS